MSNAEKGMPRVVRTGVLIGTLFASCVAHSQGNPAAEPAKKDIFYAGSAEPNDNQPHGLLSERITDKKKGQDVLVVVDGCKYKDVKFDEKERHSRFYEDIHAIFGKIFAAGAAIPQSCWKRYPYTLQYDRSQLTITAVGKDDIDTGKITVVVGPKEHLYLGVDLPVSQRKNLKYDSNTKTLQPQNDNPQLYLSLNWYLGDLAANQEKLDAISMDRISLKAFVLASSRPLDSYGVGLGYQLPKFAAFDLSALSIFMARFWTKQDSLSSAGAPEKNQATGRDWRFGLTYDLGTGLKWVKTN